jgi:hypothetical protein
MKPWLLIIGAALLVLIVLLVYVNHQKEGFTTIDLPTAVAQRQQLQWEGERRYNNLARLQAPTVNLDADNVDDAVRQVVPVPNSRTPSLFSLLSMTTLGAADNGSNKQGTGVEQTGMVQSKINFCESLTTVDCAQLDDPRLAECGFCHRDGVNSRGKGWRGGMYISSDDQIRANEVANATGAAAIYQPTVGTCKPENFTLVNRSCAVREAQLQCLTAGAATAANQCGQCYGASASLLFTGPKSGANSLLPTTTTLWVSHPGGHNNGGVGLSVSSGGQVLATLPPSSQPALDPKSLTFTVTEGQTYTITVYGLPKVWCGWMSNASGTRTVSLDVGEQTISPSYGYTIAGDKNAGPVTSAVGNDPAWSTFQAQVPNTVLWYQRRDEAVGGMVVSAWYGVTPNPSDGQGEDVTSAVKMAAGTNTDFVVAPNSQYGVTDPAFGTVKHVWITLDNGNVITAVDGQTVPGSDFQNTMVMTFTMPATLRDPIFSDDQAACPIGPLVLTEIGAGLMGSHSCFGPGGVFNPSLYCMQELFTAAGGTTKGTAYPTTAAAAASLAQKGGLDATMAYLNAQANIAIYGVDVNGSPVDFATYKAAAMAMLGIAPLNPCQGPLAATGPHSPECLDYLYRTSGNPATDNVAVDPTTLPYAYCGTQGSVAPLNADGSVNQGNVTAANAFGGVSGIRQFFQGIFNRAADTTDFDAQAQAMQQCFNIKLVPPPPATSNCPAPNPTEWQCYTPAMIASVVGNWVQIATSGSWYQDPQGGQLITIGIADDGTMCGSNQDINAFLRSGLSGGWNQLPGNLIQMDCKSAGLVVGVGNNFGTYGNLAQWLNGNYIYSNVMATWVSVGSDGTLCYVDTTGTPYLATGGNVATAIWTAIGKANTVSQVAVGNSENIWAVSPAGVAIQWASGKWNPVAGPQMSRVAVSGDGSKVAGMDTAGNVYGLSTGNTWLQIPIPFPVIGIAISNGYLVANQTGSYLTWFLNIAGATETPISANAIPALTQNYAGGAPGNAMCASQDGQNCYYFPDANTCQAWTSNQSSMTMTSAPAPVSLGSTMPQSGRFIARDDGSIYWNRNGTNIVNHVLPSDCSCPSNPCVSSQTYPATQFNSMFSQQADYYCGMGSVVDLYNSQRV